MRSVAEAVLERFQDQVALDFGHGAADEVTRDLFGCHYRKTLARFAPPRGGAQCAPHPARFAKFKVSVRLIPDEKAWWNYTRGQCATKPAVRRQFAVRGEEGLLAILLDARQIGRAHV